MDRAKELEYILKFARESDFDLHDVCRRQLRSLWTAYCLHHNLDVDTAEYDKDIQKIWREVEERNKSHYFWRNFYDFDLDMSEYLC